MLYFLTAFSILMMMGVVPDQMHSASLEVVWNDLDIFIFISLCTLEYFRPLYSYFIVSNQIVLHIVVETVSPLCISSSAPIVLIPKIFLLIWLDYKIVFLHFSAE